ncbi:MAG: peptidase U32 family protein [Anaerovoracaceae bacterium]|jgi:putative protease
MRKPELLAPCGDLEKLHTAIAYGADAVYFGGERFSLRAGAGNLTRAEMDEAVRTAHARGVRCYLTLNIYPRNEDLAPLEDYLRGLRPLGLDAVLVSDPAVLELVREQLPGVRIHLSTQANAVNCGAVRFWQRQGISRVVLARELSLEEIAEIRRRVPAEVELEAFVQGAMCVSYSGRCLLSSFLTGRDANRGDCAQPCRWRYHLVEAQRPGEYYPIEEDDRGTYLLNARDLCMLEHIPDLAAAGIDALKIEGRMKSVFYVACAVGAYRRALDAWDADPENWRCDPAWMRMLKRASHRRFTTGFYYGPPGAAGQDTATSARRGGRVFCGVVRGYDAGSGVALVEQRNKMTVGDEIEIFGPDESGFVQTLTGMEDADGAPLQTAPHPQQMLRIRTERPVGPLYMLCKGKETHDGCTPRTGMDSVD